MTAAKTGAVHQPGMFNIEAWGGGSWRGGMNRATRGDAISAARRWSAEGGGRRYRVFDVAGNVIFDTADPVDVLAVMTRSAHQHWEHEDNADAEDAEAALAAVAEAIGELEKAHQIILIALNSLPPGAKREFERKVIAAGLDGVGTTRYHERRAALARVQGSAT